MSFNIKLIRKKRLMIIVGILSGTFSILSFFSETFLFQLNKSLNLSLFDSSTPIFSLIVSLFSFFFVYLQSGAKEAPERDNSPILEKIIREMESQKNRTAIQLEELKRKLEIYESNKGLSDEEKRQLLPVL